MANDTKDTPAKTAKDIKSACEISINQIFIQLHFKAVEEANKVNKDIKVLNSIVEGDDEKSAKFYGAGQHIIVAISPDKDKKITAAQALPSLLTYVQWFSGPDIKLTEDQLFNLDQSDNAGTGTKLKEKKDDKNDDKKEQKESNMFVPTFSQYLLTEDDPTVAGEDPEGPDQEDVDALNDATDAAAEDADAGKPDEKKDEGGETGSGWYFTYNVDIKGQKKHPLVDALKSLGKKILEGFGVLTFDWRTGANGDVKTLGDLVDTLDAVFGKMDPDELLKKYETNIKKTFPQGESHSSIWDTKTIKLHLKKQLDSKALAKLKEAELALCTRVDKRDKSYKLYNTQLIADTVTKSIQGIFKKFKNKVEKKDVVLVNNYSDDKKDKDEKQYTGKKGEGAVADSILNKYNGKLIIEEKEEKEKLDEKTLSDNLLKIAESGLTDFNVEAIAAKTDDIINKLKENKINDTDLITSLLNAKHSFMLKLETKEQKQEDQTLKKADTKENKDVNAKESLVRKSLLSLLFEKQLEKDEAGTTEKVKKVFKEFLEQYKDNINGDIDVKAVDGLVGYIPDDSDETQTQEEKTEESKNESIITNKTIAFMNMLYENFDYKFLLEANDTYVKEINFKIKDIGLKAIKNNEKEITDKFNQIIDKKKKDIDYKKSEGYLKILDALFKSKDEDSAIAAFTKIADEKGYSKLLGYLKPCLEGIKKEDEQEKVKVNFYDADPKTGEKIGDPLNKEPFEVEKESRLKDNEDIVDAVNQDYNKKLNEEKPGEGDKEGYIKRGWTPDINDAVAEDDPTEIIAKYIEEEKKDEEYTVELTYNPDPENRGEIKTIQIDGEDKLKVKAGEAAKLPEEMPKIEGYKFKDWGNDTEKLKKVEEDIVALAEYVKNIKIIAKAPKDPEKTEDVEPIEKEPREYDPEKPIKDQLPEPPSFDGWEFDGWDPDPDSIKDPKEDIEITAKYKKKDEPGPGPEGDKPKTIWYVIPDDNGLLKDEQSAAMQHTELDFYIIPMKGLSYNTRKREKEEGD